MRYHTHLSLYLLTLVTLAATAWAYQTTIDVSIQARGIVRPEGDVVRIISEVSGRIMQVRAREGATVHAGDTLIQLDTRDLRLKHRMIQSKIHATESRLEQLRQTLADTADIEHRSHSADTFQESASQRILAMAVDSANARFAQTDRLYKEGLASRQAFDDAVAALDRAAVELSKWTPDTAGLRKAQLELRARNRDIEVDSMRAEVTNLYQQLEQNQFEIARRTITSPMDGRITSFAPLHPGEVLASGLPIATLVPEGHPLIIESWLPAHERHWLREGQLVRVRRDNEFSFDAYVQSVSADARIADSQATYRIVLTPAPFSPALTLGATFELHFVTYKERLLRLVFRKLRT